MKHILLLCCGMLMLAGSVHGSGFGVFTQGAAALGQANAVVAQPLGPSAVYFNPALLNDVAGTQVEVGLTGIYADRKISLASGGTENGDSEWNLPSTFYASHQINDSLTAGFGAFFPFGLSTSWEDDYAGRYLGTSGDIFTLNLNPVLSWRATPRLSLAFGVSALYLDADLQKKINQNAAYGITDLMLGGGVLPEPEAPLADIDQKFTGDGWGYGYNLGAYFQAHERVHLGLTYRSHIDVDVKGQARFANVNPLLAAGFPNTSGASDIRLPAQATAGVAVMVTERLTTEVGLRWEDWSSTKNLRIDLAQPVFGQTEEIIPRDWRATWSYNVGARYQARPDLALLAGYLFGENAVPGSTFEPLVPDSDAHLFTVGAEWSRGAWLVAGAFGYEYHRSRDKDNSLGDPLGSLLAGDPVGTANGSYDTDLYLVGLSLGYRF
ncbi:MAG: outer membrane protein transport protein [Pelovirga sp.]